MTFSHIDSIVIFKQKIFLLGRFVSARPGRSLSGRRDIARFPVGGGASVRHASVVSALAQQR